MGSLSGSIRVGRVVESAKFSMDGRSRISTPSTVTVHTTTVVGGGKPWYVPIKYGS